jgi:hypothetical protein
MSWNYNVPLRKAANIRLALSEHIKIAPDIRVKYAKMSHGGFTPTVHAIAIGVPGDDFNCIEAVTLRELGQPALVRRREAAVLEKTKRGEPIIILYAKNCEQTDKFDATGKVDEMYRFNLHKWPPSWRPAHRQWLAERRRNEIKNGAKVKQRGKRQNPRSVQQTAVRLTSFT